MNKALFFLGLLLLPFFLEAQEAKSKIDSLKLALKKNNGNQKFNTLILLSDEYSNSHLDQAMFYAKKSLQKAEQLKNKTYTSLAFNTIGNIYQYKSESDSALIFHKKALLFRQSLNDTLGIAECYNNFGIAFDAKGQYSEALKYYFKALFFYDKKGVIRQQAMVLTNIGIVYKAQKEYQKTHTYYRKAYELFTKTTDSFGLTSAACNLGSILINLERYSQSLYYSEIARKGYEKLGHHRYIAYPLSNIAFAYDSLHQYKVAEINYIKSIELFKKFDNKYQVAEILNLYSNALNKQKKYQQSITQANEALLFAKKSSATLLTIQAYKNLAKAHAGLNNFDKAYHYSNLHTLGKDSLFDDEKTKTVFELETKYQTEKKEKLLIQKEAEAKQKNAILLGVSLLAFLLALIGYLIYRQQKQKNKQQKQEYELKKAIAKIESQNKLQEQRLSISRDLHDNIGAQLTFIISSVDTIKYAFEITNEKLENKLNSISSFAKETIVELRDTIWAMNSNEISFDDLETRINNYIEKAKEAKGEISFSFAIDSVLKTQKLSSVQGMNVYRTIQEAVNNSLKYANATVISISAKQIDNQLKITIQDNGIGFEIASKFAITGNGLQNMQKRIEEIGGEFHLSSSNEGTRIEILI